MRPGRLGLNVAPMRFEVSYLLAPGTRSRVRVGHPCPNRPRRPCHVDVTVEVTLVAWAVGFGFDAKKLDIDRPSPVAAVC